MSLVSLRRHSREMGSHMRTSLLLIPLSILLLNWMRIWQSLPPSINISHMFDAVLQKAAVPVAVENHDCAHNFTFEILSVDPLVIYLNNFLNERETAHLLDTTKDKFESSLVYNEKLEPVRDTRFRTSQSTMVPKNDTVSKCLAQRMKSVLGNLQHIEVEDVQVVKYEPSEEFRLHVDWFSAPRNESSSRGRPGRPYNRLMSIFAYLHDNCTGGETYFPEVQGVSSVADGDKFATTRSGRGLVVKPRRGNAVMWNNLFLNGTGDPRVVHAGLPVHTGTKIGINLFSHYFYDAPIIGGDEE